jgi:Icc-related predicted phosphoesterase
MHAQRRPGGQRCFLDLLKAVRPRVYLCGHLHVAQRRDLHDPPCAVLNTGDLPRGGHYVVLRSPATAEKAEPLSIEARRL